MNRLKRLPKLYFNNFAEPSVAHVATPDLFTRLGFIHQPNAGLVHWLPIGLMVQNKLRSLITRRMDEAGAEECRMSILSHESLWRKTGRWAGTELFKLKDSGDQNYCLTPTNEEDITNLVKLNINSYKDLPVTYYQVNEKFRDEKRPRMGLLRSKQFLMKDAYSFDLSEKDALVSYENMVSAYHKIFDDLRIPYVKALADSGDIGGSLSHEWHYVNKTGEDTLYTCSHCGSSSNVEKTLSLPERVSDVEVESEFFVSDGGLLKVQYPKNRDFQPKFLEQRFPGARRAEPAEITSTFTVVNDSRIDSDGVPLVAAEENEICHSCQKGRLLKDKAIEVGHTFYLGTKYSKPMQLAVGVPDAAGKLQQTTVLMGCYGIGISRIIAAIGEITRDEHGFRWPSIIAPWHVTVVETPKVEESQRQAVYGQLDGIDYKVDSRREGLGKKVRQSNMVGIPLVVIVGKKFPLVDIEVRGQRYGEAPKPDWEVTPATATSPEKHTVHVEQLAAAVAQLLKHM